MAGELAKLISDGASASDIEQLLDGLGDEERVQELYTLGHTLQRRLWEIAASNADLPMTDFIPKTDERVVYRGRNSMPVFRFFEKHFYRPADGSKPFGINAQAFAWFSGPGYFTCREESGMVLFDYTQAPDEHHQLGGWPKIQSNDRGIGARIVFANMIDYNRRVSKNTVIGEAHKNGKSINQFYIVTRVDA